MKLLILYFGTRLAGQNRLHLTVTLSVSERVQSWTLVIEDSFIHGIGLPLLGQTDYGELSAKSAIRVFVPKKEQQFSPARGVA